MKIEELRIGNLVIGMNGDVIEVDALPDSKMIEQFYPGCGDYYGLLKPIELTEEWLKKFGFKGDRVYKYRWNIDSFIIHLMAGSPKHKAPKDDQYWQLALDYGEYLRTEIGYVHQLQNLYFSLTHTELTIK